MRSNVSKNEWQIMEIIWQKEEMTARDIHSVLIPSKAITTVQTYLERMAAKGLLEKRKIGPLNLYRAAVLKEEMIKESLGSIVQNAFSGSFAGFVNFLFDSSHLTLDDVQELKKLLKKQEEKQC